MPSYSLRPLEVFGRACR